VILRRAKLAGWSALVAFTGVACGPEPETRPQWTLTLRTDAPLPLIADRVLVEVLADDGTLACDACRRLLDASDPAAWPLSFGVAATGARATGAGAGAAGSGLRVRARLHRARATLLDGSPGPRNTLDVLVRMPAAPGPVAVPLGMRCFGVPSTDTETCEPTTGALQAIALAPGGAGDPAMQPGSWQEGQVAPCPTGERDAMTCVSGGLFFFGSFEREDAANEQLVRVSSFLADRDEMTVGDARALMLSGAVAGRPLLRGPGRTAESTCTFRGTGDPSADALPLNCVSRDLARELCVATGRRLLTEAELAYAAANGALGTRYPWGNEEDICARAVIARGATAFELDETDGVTECRTQPGGTVTFGPTIGGSSTDVTLAWGVRNLGGNLAEWVEDTFAALGDPCWVGRPVLIDPICRSGEGTVLRGGAWSFEAWSAGSRVRTQTTSASSTAVGLRCARSL